MIKITNVSYAYKNEKPIVFPDFEVSPEQPLLITGASGCGKTTLLHLLAGLLKPLSGQIFINNSDLTSMSPSKTDNFRGQHIGMVYQKPHFINALSVLDNLLVSPYSKSAKQATTIAQRLNFEHCLPRLPKQLSVGELQRASIARAVMNSPVLLLADEPTSALDSKSCNQVVELLLQEAAMHKAALIIVSHDDRLRSDISNNIELAPCYDF